MPLSSTANASCDVNKNGGNDSSFAGPFNTIQSAITYLTTNFSLSASQHGVIYIGPGVYDSANDAISVTAADEKRFIDFVGIDKNDTIIRTTGSGVVDVTAAGAENRFRNLTIETTSTTAANYALNIGTVTDVIFQNCRIKSAARCIHNFGPGASMFDCEIVSTSTNAENVIASVSGLMSECIITATSLASPGDLVNVLAATGILEYCKLNAKSSGTAVDARGVSTVIGKISYCTIETQGYCTIVTENGGIIEYSYLSCEGTSGSKCADQFSACSIRYCFFHQKGTSNVIARGATANATTIVFNSTFYAPSSSANIVGNLEIDNSVWESCTFINDGTAGYSLAASAIDRKVTIGDLNSNRPLDPQFNMNDKGLESTTIHLGKGYSQKRSWQFNCNGSQVNSIGVTHTLVAPGGGVNGNDADGPAITETTGGVASTSAYIHTVFTALQRRHNPTLYVKFAINNTNVRFWCGLFVALPGNVTTLATQGAGIRFDDGAGDTNFMAQTYDGTTASAAVSTGVAPGNGVMRTLKITFDNANSIIYFQVDPFAATPGAVVSINSNLPGSSTDLGFAIQITNQTASSRSFKLYDVWCEYNA